MSKYKISWQERYKEFVSKEGEGAYSPDEELVALEKLIRDTGKVGKAMVMCLERMLSDDMYVETVGMGILLTEFREMMAGEQNMKNTEDDTLELRSEAESMIRVLDNAGDTDIKENAGLLEELHGRLRDINIALTFLV